MKYSYLKEQLKNRFSYIYEMDDWNAPRSKVYIEAILGQLIEENAKLTFELQTEREVNARVNQVLSRSGYIKP